MEQGAAAGQDDAETTQLVGTLLVGRAHITSGPYGRARELFSIRPVYDLVNQASLGRARGVGRKGDGEAGPLPGTGTVRREAAVVRLDDCAGDRQSET